MGRYRQQCTKHTFNEKMGGLVYYKETYRRRGYLHTSFSHIQDYDAMLEIMISYFGGDLMKHNKQVTNIVLN